LVNGTFAHCLDYDDTHVGCLAHLSAPTWAATLSVAAEVEASDEDVLKAFVSGFEVGARLGGGGFGPSVNRMGFHATAVFGRFSTTVAAGVLLGLNESQMKNALGAAATQVGGLVASFGTMSKPFHAGKAAMDGVLSAQLARDGFESAGWLLEEDGDGLARVLLQNDEAGISQFDKSDNWEILQNTFKPYAACLVTHPIIESAQAIYRNSDGRRIEDAIAHVSPMVPRFAAKTAPQTPLEGKFSVAFCTALALCGHQVGETDFTNERLQDPDIRDMEGRVQLSVEDEMEATAGSVTVTFSDGEEMTIDTPLAKGNPGNPLGWEGMRWKFMSLVEPALGDDRAVDLYSLIREFGDGKDFSQIAELMSHSHGEC
jgi:2-methylcitrate dehydratase PrpD